MYFIYFTRWKWKTFNTDLFEICRPNKHLQKRLISICRSDNGNVSSDNVFVDDVNTTLPDGHQKRLDLCRISQRRRDSDMCRCRHLHSSVRLRIHGHPDVRADLLRGSDVQRLQLLRKNVALSTLRHASGVFYVKASGLPILYGTIPF